MKGWPTYEELVAMLCWLPAGLVIGYVARAWWVGLV